jgi:uncharacterized membrane protein YeaQ/YmgE (transglycosylase-associated protein family)
MRFDSSEEEWAVLGTLMPEGRFAENHLITARDSRCVDPSRRREVFPPPHGLPYANAGFVVQASSYEIDVTVPPGRRRDPSVDSDGSRRRKGNAMNATDPVVTFLLILVIGLIAGVLFDRLAGPSWLARQFAGSTRGLITSALVGVAGAFVGYHIAVLLAVGSGLVTSVIAAAAGAAIVLLAWRLAK